MWTTTEMLGVSCNILIDLDVMRKVSVENNLVDKATATSSATKQAMFPSHLPVKVCSQVKFILLTIEALPPPSQQDKLPTLLHLPLFISFPSCRKLPGARVTEAGQESLKNLNRITNSACDRTSWAQETLAHVWTKGFLLKVPPFKFLSN